MNHQTQSSQMDIQKFNQLIQTPQFQYVRHSYELLKKYVTHQHFDALYTSFNGGKDATVVLFLTLVAMQNGSLGEKKLKCLYFSEPNSFQKIDNFIQYSKKRFNLQWNELKTKEYGRELKEFSQQRQLKFVVMGTRKDDPYCQHLGKEAPSDTHKGYPAFLRINPIFQWTYEQVWAFIKGFGIPYCELYDQGYTYLGNKSNTTKNEALLDKQTQKYQPAFVGHSEIQKKSRIQVQNEISG